jgi:hypothetical protein
MDARHESAHHSRSVHFLIWLSETERMCSAVQRLAADDAIIPLGEQTIAALRSAHDGACGHGVGNTTFRFKVPAGAEQLMAAAAIRVRRDERHPFGLFLSRERAEGSA